MGCATERPRRQKGGSAAAMPMIVVMVTARAVMGGSDERGNEGSVVLAMKTARVAAKAGINLRCALTLDRPGPDCTIVQYSA